MIDVSGVNGWSIWQRSTRGVLTYVGYARGSGGNWSVLVRGPGGAAYGDTGNAIVKVENTKLVTTLEINKVHDEYFSLTYFAFGPRGSVYADEIPGNIGFEAHQQLVSVSGSHVRLLWQERNAVAK